MFWAIRKFVKKWLAKPSFRGLPVFNIIEYCEDCGIKQALVWHADDKLWLAVTGKVNGVFCPECFDRRAWDKGIDLSWKPVVEWQSKVSWDRMALPPDPPEAA